MYLANAGLALDRARDLIVASGLVKLVAENADRVPVIDQLRDTVQQGQQQLLISKNTYARMSAEELDVIFHALASVS